MNSNPLRGTPLCWALCCFGFARFATFGSSVPQFPALGASSQALAPSAVVADPHGSNLFLACSESNEILVVEPNQRRVTRRWPVPGSPSGLALTADGTRLFVTCSASQSVVCSLDVETGKCLSRIPAGHTAMAPVLAKDEQTLFVCDRFNDSIGIIDLGAGKEVDRIKVAREPVAATLTPDGNLLFVANHIHNGRSDVGVVAASVSVVDVKQRRLVKNISLPNGSSLLRGICVSPDGQYVAVTHILARFHLPTTHVDHGWMNDNALSLLDVKQLAWVNTVLLDNVDRGAANPWAVAWSSDGQQILVTHAGTHELSVINASGLLAKLDKLPKHPDPQAKPDYSTTARTVADVPNDLAFLVGLRSRIKLPGKGPRGLALFNHQAFITHFFSDSLAIVDCSAAPYASSQVCLSTNSSNSLVRKGELYFNDATLCYQGWQSCASCHSSDARVDGLNWDLLNDGIGNPKNVKSLLLAFQTGPAMALGVRADAKAAVRAGIKYILFADLPEEVPAAIDEYLKSLAPIPSPHLVHGELSPAANRGKQLFMDKKVGCAVCHPAPLFTDLKPHAVGSGKFDEAGDRFYTSTLIEVWRTAPYLHDGRGATLHDVVSSHNSGDRRGHTSQLTPAQIDDLVSYLQSL